MRLAPRAAHMQLKRLLSYELLTRTPSSRLQCMKLIRHKLYSLILKGEQRIQSTSSSPKLLQDLSFCNIGLHLAKR